MDLRALRKLDLRALRKLSRLSSQSIEASTNTVRNESAAKQDIPEKDMVDGASSSAAITKMAKDAVAIIRRSSATQPRGKAYPSKRRYVRFDQLEYATTSGKTVDISMKQRPRGEVVPKRKKTFDLLEYARGSKNNRVVIETPDQPSLAHYSAAVQPIGADDIMLTHHKAVQNSSEEIKDVNYIGFDDPMASSVEQSRLTGTSHPKEASSAASSILTPALLRNADDIRGAANDVSSLTPQAQSTLSEYEKSRARHIERNNARLRSLGLITVAQERRLNDAAWGRGSTDNNEEDIGYLASRPSMAVGKNSAKTKKRFIPKEGSRKSNRQMNIPAKTCMIAERVYRNKRLDEIFAAKLGLVREFWELHGRSPRSSNNATPHEIKLESWVSRNRHLLYYGRLSPDRAAAINAIHPDLLKRVYRDKRLDEIFAANLDLMREFWEMHGRCPCFDKDAPPLEIKLAHWIFRQRHALCYGYIAPDRLAAINAVHPELLAPKKHRKESSRDRSRRRSLGPTPNQRPAPKKSVTNQRAKGCEASDDQNLRETRATTNNNTTCSVCCEEFDHDPTVVKDRLLSRLPVQSSRCCHKICYSCLRQIKLSLADDKNRDPSSIKWVKCPMGCRINTCFNTEDPIVDLHICSLIEGLHSRTMSDVITTCPLCYDEFDDDPSAVKDKSMSHLPVQSSKCCHKCAILASGKSNCLRLTIRIKIQVLSNG